MSPQVEWMKWTKLLSNRSLGKRNRQQPNQGSLRSEFERDYDRVVFSYSFRRLQNKTQVHPFPQFDFIHNRLTHSLEASCVGRSLGKAVKPIMEEKKDIREIESELEERGIYLGDIADIVSAACLVHDIGNPPFGHAGEEAISNFFINSRFGKEIIELLKNEKKVQDLLNFEGNAQAFSNLNKIHKIPDLTCATLASSVKYPRESYKSINYIESESKSRKDQKKYGFFQLDKSAFLNLADEVGLLELSVEDIARCRHPLAYLVEAADDICYKITDLEDAIKHKYINLKGNEEPPNTVNVEEHLTKIIQDIPVDYKEFGLFDVDYYNSLDEIGQKIGYLRAKAINSLVYQAADAFNKNYPYIMTGRFKKSLIDVIKSSRKLKTLFELTREKYYQCRTVLEMEAAGFEIIGGLLEYFTGYILDSSNKQYDKIWSLLPPEYNTQDGDIYIKVMAIIDYISGMSDKFALDLYRHIKGITLPHGN